MNRSKRFFIQYFTLALFLSACATAPYTGRTQLMLIDPGQEMALGQQAAQQIMQEVPVSNDPRLVGRVRNVGQRIAQAANRPDFNWEFHVIDEPNQINAFALPGGKVFVYTGMLRLADTDAELATVMAHEIAHVLTRHGAERMSNALLAQMGGAAAAQALNIQSPGALQAFNVAYGLATNVGVILPHSRSQETEADRIGLILMAQAGYDPRAAVSFWEKMMGTGKGARGPAFLSTHPTDQQRIAQIQSFLPEAMRYYRGT